LDTTFAVQFQLVYVLPTHAPRLRFYYARLHRVLFGLIPVGLRWLVLRCVCCCSGRSVTTFSLPVLVAGSCHPFTWLRYVDSFWLLRSVAPLYAPRFLLDSVSVTVAHVPLHFATVTVTLHDYVLQNSSRCLHTLRFTAGYVLVPFAVLWLRTHRLVTGTFTCCLRTRFPFNVPHRI